MYVNLEKKAMYYKTFHNIARLLFTFFDKISVTLSHKKPTIVIATDKMVPDAAFTLFTMTLSLSRKEHLQKCVVCN